MNRHPNTDPDQDPKNDAAWDLLLEARQAEVSPLFARNVLREVRLAKSDKNRAATGWRSILSLPRLLSGAAAVVIVVAIIVASDLSSPTAQETDAIAQTTEPLPAEVATTDLETVESTETFDMSDYEDEIEMIDYLDGLLAVQDITMLDDEALSELLF